MVNINETKELSSEIITQLENKFKKPNICYLLIVNLLDNIKKIYKIFFGKLKAIF